MTREDEPEFTEARRLTHAEMWDALAAGRDLPTVEELRIAQGGSPVADLDAILRALAEMELEREHRAGHCGPGYRRAPRG